MYYSVALKLWPILVYLLEGHSAESYFLWLMIGWFWGQNIAQQYNSAFSRIGKVQRVRWRHSCAVVQCFAAMDKRMDTSYQQTLEHFHHFLTVVSTESGWWQASFRQHTEIDSLADVSVMEKVNSWLTIWYKIPHIIMFVCFWTCANSRYQATFLLLLSLCTKLVLGLHPKVAYACVHIHM